MSTFRDDFLNSVGENYEMEWDGGKLKFSVLRRYFDRWLNGMLIL